MEDKEGGAFWFATDQATGEKKLNKKGEKYWTGKITIKGETVNALMFFNREKQNPRSPDFNILINRPPTEEPKKVETLPPEEVSF